jgi:hypothetical protein
MMTFVVWGVPCFPLQHDWSTLDVVDNPSTHREHPSRVVYRQLQEGPRCTQDVVDKLL